MENLILMEFHIVWALKTSCRLPARKKGLKRSEK